MVTPYEDSAMQAIARFGLSPATKYATPMLMQKDTRVVTQIKTTLPCGQGWNCGQAQGSGNLACGMSAG